MCNLRMNTYMSVYGSNVCSASGLGFFQRQDAGCRKLTTLPDAVAGCVLGCREARGMASGVGKHNLRVGKPELVLGDPQVCNEARAMGFSDSWTSRHP